jgi:hypothetical protein
MTRRGRDRMPRALGEPSVIHARQMGGPGPASLGVRKKDETRRVLIIGGRKGLAWSAAVPTKPSTGMGTSGPFIFFPRSGRDQSGPVVPVRSEEEVGAMLRVHEASFLVVPCAGRRAGVHTHRARRLFALRGEPMSTTSTRLTPEEMAWQESVERRLDVTPVRRRDEEQVDAARARTRGGRSRATARAARCRRSCARGRGRSPAASVPTCPTRRYCIAAPNLL